ncbi:MAG TPA: class I SAM-dependent methyltransferase [Planctomycetota bacterium]|nr:class I SAM-dependent methyltransferase [Planctomycetota bacterium]
MPPLAELVCPACEASLAPQGEALACREGHRWPALRAGFDFLREGERPRYPEGASDRLLRMQGAHFWFVSRRRLILDWLARCCRPGGVFVDVGTGSGDVASLARRRGFRAAAADVLVESDESVRRLDPALPFHAVSVYGLPFRGLDAAGLFDVLEHLDDPIAALASVRRALRPGGSVLLTVPARRELWTNVDLYSGHRLRYDRRGLLAVLRAAGLRPTRASYFMLPLVPAIVASRRLGAENMPDGLDDAAVQEHFEAVARVPGWPWNDLAQGILSLERFWLRLGDLPYGASLIACARREASVSRPRSAAFAS